MVKSLGGQRESEGVVVPLIGVRDTPGGKDPCFDHAREAGKRKGMTGSARSNYPGKSSLAVADGEGAALAGHDHQIVVAAEDHGECEGAFEPL